MIFILVLCLRLFFLLLFLEFMMLGCFRNLKFEIWMLVWIGVGTPPFFYSVFKDELNLLGLNYMKSWYIVQISYYASNLMAVFMWWNLALTLPIKGMSGVWHMSDTDTCDYIQLCHFRKLPSVLVTTSYLVWSVYVLVLHRMKLIILLICMCC